MRKTIFAVLGSLLTLSILVGAANANLITIDFETDAEGNPIAHGTALTDEYEEWGVLFDGNNPILAWDNYATSGSNVLAPDDPYQGDFLISFTEPIDYVEFTGIDVGENGLSITGFDVDGNEIAYDEVFGTGVGVGQNYDLSIMAEGISYIVISQVQDVVGDGYLIDDLTFGTTPVPEPATMLLFGTGIAGFAGSQIRRRKKKH